MRENWINKCPLLLLHGLCIYSFWCIWLVKTFLQLPPASTKPFQWNNQFHWRCEESQPYTFAHYNSSLEHISWADGNFIFQMESISAIGSFTLGSADPTVFAFTRAGSATAWSRQPPACRPDNVRVPSGGIFLRERKHNRTVVNTCLGFKTYLLKKKKTTLICWAQRKSMERWTCWGQGPCCFRWNEWQWSYKGSPPWSSRLSLSRITSHFSFTFCREFYPLEMLTVTEHGTAAAN